MQLKKILRLAALFAVLAQTTNSLLILHLRACQIDHPHQETEEHHSDEDHHDSENCPICQDLLITTGQYTIDSPQMVLFAEIESSHQFKYTTTLLPQFTYNRINPRGPPLS